MIFGLNYKVKYLFIGISLNIIEIIYTNYITQDTDHKTKHEDLILSVCITKLT